MIIHFIHYSRYTYYFKVTTPIIFTACEGYVSQVFVCSQGRVCIQGGGVCIQGVCIKGGGSSASKGGWGLHPGGVASKEGGESASRGSASKGEGLCIKGGGALHPRGMGSASGGVCNWRGVCIHGVGVCIQREGVCIRGGWADTPLTDTTGYGQRAGGTHPTGMHYFFVFVFNVFDFLVSIYVQTSCRLQSVPFAQQ